MTNCRPLLLRHGSEPVGSNRVSGKTVPETSVFSYPSFSIGTRARADGNLCNASLQVMRVAMRFRQAAAPVFGGAACPKVHAFSLAWRLKGQPFRGVHAASCNRFADKITDCGTGAKKLRLDQEVVLCPTGPDAEAAFRGSFRPGMVRRCHTPGPFLGTKALSGSGTALVARFPCMSTPSLGGENNEDAACLNLVAPSFFWDSRRCPAAQS